MHIIKERKPLRLVKSASAAKKNPAAENPGKSPAGSSEYYRRIERCARQIRRTDNLNEIINILDVALLETRSLYSSDEVRSAQEQVQRAEQKIELLKSELEQLSELVHADPLTGAFNRGGLDDAFAREAARADRNDAALCVALLDMDNFKRLNDTCGHQAGDNALLHLVNVARETLRPNDIIARFGGEEFVILLPDTRLDAAMSVMCRLQHDLAISCVSHTSQPQLITFSAGVAAREPYEHQSTVLNRADKALYRAKHAGKNRVIAALS